MAGADPVAATGIVTQIGANAPALLTTAVVSRGRGVACAPLPRDVTAHVRHCLLDWIGVTLAGAREETTAVLRAHVLEDPGRARATLLGTGERVGLGQAALVNGTAAHALDYDDVVPAMSGHPSAPVFSALLALGEDVQLSGAEFVAAFAAGFETECAIGRLVAPGHYGAGWHATGTLGTFGAAAACAAALDLDELTWRHALGLAGTSASGLQGVFGTMAKPLHAGLAAVRGLTAAQLARRGFTASPSILDVRHGFAAAFTSTPPSDACGLPGPGEYDLRNVLFKFHAACYGAHASLEAVLALLEDLSPGDVTEVELRVPARVAAGTDGPYPGTGLEAKFRLRFVIALALTGRGTGVSAFADDVLTEEGLRAAHDKVRVTVDPAITQSFVADAVVRTADGREWRRRADVTVPTPAAQLAARWDKLVAKFADLARPVLGSIGASRVIDAVRQVEELDSVAALAEAVVAD